LKSKVETKKITVRKYKETVTKLRSKMTISLTGYQEQMKEVTTTMTTGKITPAEFEVRSTLLKKRLKTTLKVQKIRTKKGKPGCIPASSVKELLNCDTCIRAAQRIKAEIKKQDATKASRNRLDIALKRRKRKTNKKAKKDVKSFDVGLKRPKRKTATKAKSFDVGLKRPKRKAAAKAKSFDVGLRRRKPKKAAKKAKEAAKEKEDDKKLEAPTKKEEKE